MLEMTTLTPAVKYAVGIDFGHGECSAAFCEIGWGKSNQLLDSPADIRLYGNDKFTIPSAYSVSHQGKMLVGHSAINNIKDARHFKISFKKRPSEMDEEEARLYSEYLGNVHKHIIGKSGVLATGNYVVYLSCPSGWGENDRTLFFQMATKQGIPVAGLWAESRAGLFSNMENQSEAQRELMREGCILADIGSSTIDFSYLNSSLNTPIMDYGIQDGAQALDMMLYYYILSLPGNEKAKELVEQKDLKWLKDVLVYTCRAAKEAFFGADAETSLICNYDFREVFVDDEVKADARFRCNKEHGGDPQSIMNLFMNGLASVGLSVDPDEQFAGVDWSAVNNGYFSVIAERLEQFVSNHVKDQPVKIILLSGGASYMFLSEHGQNLFRDTILKRAFPNSFVEIGFDGKPSTSVSRGICSLGRAYARYIGCEDDSDENAYESLNTKANKTLDYHTSILGMMGRTPETKDDSEPLSSKIPFTESAKYFIHALAGSETHLFACDLSTHQSVLTSTASPDHPMPEVMSNSLLQEYEEFLSKAIKSSKSVTQIVSDTIVETIMPMTREFINSFEGENLQELKEGLAQVVKDNYSSISKAATDSAKEFIKENLVVERKYVSDLISLYTASLQRDFMIDNESINAAFRLPSVDQLLEEIDFYDILDMIATSILSFMMLVVNWVVSTLLLGVPWILSYVAFVIKEKFKNWSLDDWSEWHNDMFVFVDFSKFRLHNVGRAAIRRINDKNYSKNMRKMKENICKSLIAKDFDKSVIDAFSVVAKNSMFKYLDVMDNIFS